MSKRSGSRTANVNAAIWLIGLGILWLTDLWWPGILILIGLSMLVNATQRTRDDEEPEIITKTAPLSEEKTPAEAPEEVPWAEDEAETPSFVQAKQFRGDPLLLPENCPSCGGPVAQNAHKVEWMGQHTARCPFCDTVLTL